MKYNVELNLSLGTSHSLILSKITKGSRVLEFGPASGYMTKYMKEVLECDVYCVEIDEEAAAYASNYAKAMVIGDIENMNWLDKYGSLTFDYILFADVLEHLRNPQHILKVASTLLKDEGTIITSVPNISHNAIIMELMQGNFDYQSTGLLDNTHVKFFTRKNVIKMLDYAELLPTEWLVTQHRPETTEFKQDYRYFPKEVSDYLRQLPDGDVYQFVTVSQKKHHATNTNISYEHKYDNYLDSDYIQIFWDNNVAYSEQASVKIAHINTTETTEYNIILPKVVSGKIRIDISSKFVFGEILDIRIKDKQSNTIFFEWDYKVENLQYSGLHIKQSEDKADFIVTDEDPRIMLPVNIDKNEHVEYVLEIKLKMNGNYFKCQNELLEHLKDSQNELLEHLEDSQSRFNQLENTITVLENKVSLLESLVSQLETENVKLVEDIRRNMAIENKLQDLKQIQDDFNSNLENISTTTIDIKESLNDYRLVTKENFGHLDHKVMSLTQQFIESKSSVLKRIYRKFFN